MTFIRWERPRRWAISLYEPRSKKDGVSSWVGGWHKRIGVVAYSAFDAMNAAQKQYPDARIESANDTGEIDIVVDYPKGGIDQ